MYGLKECDIDKIKSVFCEYPEIEKVILYGSRAKGNYRANSDIDLSIIGSVDLGKLIKIETKLDDLLLPYLMDLSIFDKIKNNDLVEHINRAGIIFYKKIINQT
ncbi:MAG: putative nucleotidyltransferase [Flavobacteriales bacterium]|jgi:predicted nucleotidyltransferase